MNSDENSARTKSPGVLLPGDADGMAISLRNISKNYRLWHKSGSGFFRQVARVFSKGERAAKQDDDHIYPALRNISFEIKVGESVGIIGRNGCGKSTLLQILAGILKPTAGTGTVNGTVAALLELGTGFHPDFTGRENVELNNALLDLSREESQRRTTRIEEFAAIGRFMDEPIRTYSSGMMLRLGFACAVAVDPDVFLVDESLSVGDIFFQQKCFGFMREQMGMKTRVIVSHDMHSITAFCSRVIVLDGGMIVFDGAPLQGVEYYIKALHDSQTGAARRDGARPKAKVAPPSHIEWRPVPCVATGGAGEVEITRFEVRVNGVAFAGMVKPGDLVCLRLAIECREAKLSLLFGYILRDKTGAAIFGENSASVQGGIVAAEAGQSQAELNFVWPEVQPGEYFLTPGVGEGRDPVRHRIQCWAHNIHLFNAISPGKPVHCLMNNPLRDFKFSALAEAPVATELEMK